MFVAWFSYFKSEYIISFSLLSFKLIKNSVFGSLTKYPICNVPFFNFHVYKWIISFYRANICPLFSFHSNLLVTLSTTVLRVLIIMGSIIIYAFYNSHFSATVRIFPQFSKFFQFYGLLENTLLSEKSFVSLFTMPS